MPFDPAQSLMNLRLERDAILLYDALASVEKDEHRADAFRRIAGNERRHAEVWATKLREAGVDVPPPPTRPRPRVAVIVLLARLFGTRAVSELVTALEGDEEDIYEGQGASPEVEAIAADEREHAEIWRRL
jgi:rubrerythrin